MHTPQPHLGHTGSYDLTQPCALEVIQMIGIVHDDLPQLSTKISLWRFCKEICNHVYVRQYSTLTISYTVCKKVSHVDVWCLSFIFYPVIQEAISPDNEWDNVVNFLYTYLWSFGRALPRVPPVLSIQLPRDWWSIGLKILAFTLFMIFCCGELEYGHPSPRVTVPKCDSCPWMCCKRVPIFTFSAFLFMSNMIMGVATSSKCTYQIANH